MEGYSPLNGNVKGSTTFFSRLFVCVQRYINIAFEFICTAVIEVYFTKRNEVAMLFEVGKFIFVKKIRTFVWHGIPCGYSINLFAGVSK